MHMDEDRTPRALFYRELVTEHRNQGGQKKRFNDGLKKCNVNTKTWKEWPRIGVHGVLLLVKASKV